ncbi:MAG: nicotinate phosphoribosyltransferase [Eubacterium sp.]|nr:nicotinate phosphoribosyltransferase [Eubacterium sp.]
MRNLTMLMDFYELTMANGYFVTGNKDKVAVFDMFYRTNPDGGGFVVSAGLEMLIDYVKNLKFTDDDIEYLRGREMFDEGFLDYLKNFKFTGTIEAIPEGTIVYPNIPIVTVTAPIIEAQLLETMLLICINFQSLIATKANRISRAAGDAIVMEFGARRAQGPDAAVWGTRACYIGGVGTTATVMADQQFGVKAVGTMAHSWVEFFPSEYESFKAYSEVYPDNSVLLIDTYDILESGLPNAIKVAHEVLEPMGKRLKGVRIDSGDLAYFSKKIRRRLDEEGLEDCQIVVSNSVDEYLIESLNKQGAKINSYGVGERMITSKSDPVFGGVYKLVAVKEGDEFIPKIKISENIEKITNPGKKKVYRIYSQKTGFAIADLLTLENETPDFSDSYTFIDPQMPWKNMKFRNVDAKPLQKVIFKDGEYVYDQPSLKEIQDFVKKQLTDEIWEEEQRFYNPHIHYLDLSVDLYETKKNLLSGIEFID